MLLLVIINFPIKSLAFQDRLLNGIHFISDINLLWLQWHEISHISIRKSMDYFFQNFYLFNLFKIFGFIFFNKVYNKFHGRIDWVPGIYSSCFTNVRFWKKINSSNAIFCEKHSQNYPTMKVGVWTHYKHFGRPMAKH